MKKLLLGMTLLTSLTSYAETIIFEEQTIVNTKITIVNDGQKVQHGDIEVVRAPRPITQGRVRIGDTVITSDKRTGVVKSMFIAKNTIVVYDTYYGNRTWNLSEIAVTSGCVSNSLCVDDDVITSLDKRNGKISGYFSNGTVVVYDTYYGNRFFSKSELAITSGCSGLFCIGDQVITSDNSSGVVSGFFGDGTIVVRDSYYGNRVWDQRDISITEGVCTNIYVKRVDFCN